MQGFGSDDRVALDAVPEILDAEWGLDLQCRRKPARITGRRALVRIRHK